MYKLRSCCIFLSVLFSSLVFKAQTLDLRELTPVFASNKTFKAVGEAVLKKSPELNEFNKLSSAQVKKIKKRVLRDRNIDKEKKVTVYIDVKNINYPDPKGLYFVWGYEK